MWKICNIIFAEEMTPPLKQLQIHSFLYTTASLTLKVRVRNTSINSTLEKKMSGRPRMRKVYYLMHPV